MSLYSTDETGSALFRDSILEAAYVTICNIINHAKLLFETFSPEIKRPPR